MRVCLGCHYLNRYIAVTLSLHYRYITLQVRVCLGCHYLNLTLPLHRRYVTVTLRYRCERASAVTASPLHYRYIAVTLPLHYVTGASGTASHQIPDIACTELALKITDYPQRTPAAPLPRGPQLQPRSLR